MAETTFAAWGEWLRDHYLCERCGSIPRQRAVVNVLESVKPGWRDLVVHESSPTFNFFASQCPRYSYSFLFDDVPCGQSKDGSRCENLESLTFESGRFDVFITQDVLEHVLRPDQALSEIVRVLRPGGIHICTVPKHKNIAKSYPRARSVGGRMEYLVEPQYHGNPVNNGKSLVTWDFGADLEDLMMLWTGYLTSTYLIRDRKRGIDGEFLEVFVTRKDPDNRVGP